nr:testican-2 [Parasteatoda tepidariorum]
MMKVFYFLLVLSLIAVTFAAMTKKPKAKVTACRVQRKMAKDSGDPKEFVPKCTKDGDYASIQCRQGWCWCADKSGNSLTKSQKSKPDCNAQ